MTETVDEFLAVQADLSERDGSAWTEAEVRSYLARRGLTPRAYLEEVARNRASIADYVPRPIPDPEKEPELYEHYLRSTDAMNSMITIEAMDKERQAKAKAKGD